MKDYQQNCVFCKIAHKKLSAKIVFDGSDTLFFYDKSPKARIHIVGIPKAHIDSLSTMVANDQAVMGKLLHEAAHIAEDLGIAETGYRVITNIGSDAGQEIKHIHFHILGGESLGTLRC